MQSTDSEQPEAAQLPLLDKPRHPVVYVDSASGLDAAVADLSKAQGPFALDAERASGFKYSQRAYLIQIYRPGSSIYLIDPVAITTDDDPAPFKALADLLQTDLWLLHAASQDIPCLSALGLNPTALFDTELAARLAGLERVGLGAVCETQAGIRLAKEHSAVDWSTRPLQNDWLNYAALDVDVLHDLHIALEAELVLQDKIEWAKQEFDALTRFKSKPPKVDRWRSVSGLTELKDQQSMAMLKALWEARENLAIKMDVSPGRILPDRSMISAVVAKPKTKSELAGLRSFSGRGSRTFIDIWFAALKDGSEDRNPPPIRAPFTGIPNHRNWPTKHPQAAARLQVARDAIAMLAESLKMPTENLISPDFGRQVCWDLELVDSEDIFGKLISLGARPWQAGLASPAIAAAFSSPADSDLDLK